MRAKRCSATETGLQTGHLPRPLRGKAHRRPFRMETLMNEPIRVPETMNTVGIGGGKGPAEALKLVTLPTPKPGSGQILVRVGAYNRTNDNAPSHRVFVGRAELRAACPEPSTEDRDYLSLKLDDPSFNAPHLRQPVR